MRVAIDVSPLDTTSPHNVRGSGFYLKHLLQALEKENDIVVTKFIGKDSVPKNSDIIHYPYFEPFFLTLPYKRSYKTAVTIHDLTPIIFSKNFPVGIKGTLKWMLQKKAASSVEVVITDSEASKKDIAAIMAIPFERIHVVPLAAASHFKNMSVSDEKKNILQEKYALPEKFVLYVGDVTWNKNLPRLIRAMKKIDVPLVMVGKALADKNFDRSNPWNTDRKEVEELIATTTKVTLLGFVADDDLVALYNLATVFVMPSLYEGFGLPVLEAMSCGTPVVTTQEGSLPEIAGDSAYYVDAYNEESIAEGIEKVYSDNQLQNALSGAGIKKASEYSWEKTALLTKNAYQSK